MLSFVVKDKTGSGGVWLLKRSVYLIWEGRRRAATKNCEVARVPMRYEVPSAETSAIFDS